MLLRMFTGKTVFFYVSEYISSLFVSCEVDIFMPRQQFRHRNDLGLLSSGSSELLMLSLVWKYWKRWVFSRYRRQSAKTRIRYCGLETIELLSKQTSKAIRHGEASMLFRHRPPMRLSLAVVRMHAKWNITIRYKNTVRWAKPHRKQELSQDSLLIWSTLLSSYTKYTTKTF